MESYKRIISTIVAIFIIISGIGRSGKVSDVMAASYNVVSVTITCDSPETASEAHKYIPDDGKVTSLTVGGKTYSLNKDIKLIWKRRKAGESYYDGPTRGLPVKGYEYALDEDNMLDDIASCISEIYELKEVDSLMLYINDGTKVVCNYGLGVFGYTDLEEIYFSMDIPSPGTHPAEKTTISFPGSTGIPSLESGIQWGDIDDQRVLTKDDTFVEGHKYMLIFSSGENVSLGEYVESYGYSYTDKTKRYYNNMLVNLEDSLDGFPCVNDYVINFETNGGSSVASETLTSGEKVTKPADPSKAATADFTFTFAGWYADKNLTQAFDFNKEIYSNTTIYAKWDKKAIPKASDNSKKDDNKNDPSLSNNSDNKNDPSLSNNSDNNTKSYSNEWINGKWYNEDGTQTYEATGEWKSNESGWWFEDSSGWYPVSQWQKIDGKWYYFTADGYMDYSEYRDGCWLGSDGAWVTEYNRGHWCSDSTGWWYEDASGWYPVNQYLWVDGVQYWFNANGYWE